MDKKGWIVLLLVICTFLAGALHVQLDPSQSKKLTSTAQLDSLITQTIFDFRLQPEQVRVQTIQHDSLFHRKIYTLRVPPGFSKTTFHLHLNTRLYPLNVTTYGSVEFPERNLELKIVYSQTLHRTIRIHTDSGLIPHTAIIPRLPQR